MYIILSMVIQVDIVQLFRSRHFYDVQLAALSEGLFHQH